MNIHSVIFSPHTADIQSSPVTGMMSKYEEDALTFERSNCIWYYVLASMAGKDNARPHLIQGYTANNYDHVYGILSEMAGKPKKGHRYLSNKIKENDLSIVVFNCHGNSRWLLGDKKFTVIKSDDNLEVDRDDPFFSGFSSYPERPTSVIFFDRNGQIIIDDEPHHNLGMVQPEQHFVRRHRLAIPVNRAKNVDNIIQTSTRSTFNFIRFTDAYLSSKVTTPINSIATLTLPKYFQDSSSGDSITFKNVIGTWRTTVPPSNYVTGANFYELFIYCVEKVDWCWIFLTKPNAHEVSYIQLDKGEITSDTIATILHNSKTRMLFFFDCCRAGLFGTGTSETGKDFLVVDGIDKDHNLNIISKTPARYGNEGGSALSIGVRTALMGPHNVNEDRYDSSLLYRIVPSPKYPEFLSDVKTYWHDLQRTDGYGPVVHWSHRFHDDYFNDFYHRVPLFGEDA